MIKKIVSRYGVLILLLLIIASCGSSKRTVAVENGWDLLGERKVDFLSDKDVIAVTTSSEYTSLRFKVEDHDVHINYLKVYFKNGDVLQPSIDEVIAANDQSKIIELGAQGRAIDKIEFKYHTIGSNVLQGRANVLLFGKRFSAAGY